VFAVHSADPSHRPTPHPPPPRDRLAVVAVGLLLAISTAPNSGAAPDPGPTWKAVAPILARGCVECHGREEQGAGLRLDRRADLLGEVRGKPVVVPGDPEAGRLIPAVTGAIRFKKAKLNQEHRLPDESVAQLRAWIAAGAR